MKKNLITILFLVGGCTHTLSVPSEFVYAEIKTSVFTLASWQKSPIKARLIKFMLKGMGMRMRLIRAVN